MTYDDCKKDHPGISWKDYVDLRFKDEAKALELAHAELNRRLEGMNEIRSQLDRQAGTFVTYDAFDAGIAKILARINALETMSAANEARARVYTVLVSGVVSTIVGLVVYFLARRQ